MADCSRRRSRGAAVWTFDERGPGDVDRSGRCGGVPFREAVRFSAARVLRSPSRLPLRSALRFAALGRPAMRHCPGACGLAQRTVLPLLAPPAVTGHCRQPVVGRPTRTANLTSARRGVGSQLQPYSAALSAAMQTGRHGAADVSRMQSCAL